MPGFSNFPSGFAQGITIRGVPLTVTNPGQTLWLYNGTALPVRGTNSGSDQNRGTFQRPFATLNAAVAACTAGAGDVIMVKSGHAETISSSTACSLATAGVAIVGLGVGTTRPTFTIDTANTATINVTANNISIHNCLFLANFLSIAACFTLTTAKHFVVSACEARDTSGILNFLNFVKSTGAANTVDGLSITDSAWYGLGTTSVNTLVLTANDIDRLSILRNNVVLANVTDQASLCVVTSGVLTNADIGANNVYRKSTASTNGTLVNVGGTTSTGWVYNNYVQTLGSGDKVFTTTVGLGAFQNLITDVLGASGFLIPAADV